MPKMPPPLEKEIEKKICDYAKKRKCLVYKFTSPSQRAVPDRMIITPDGMVGFLEIKREGAVPTKLQTMEMAKLKQQGCNVEWVDSVFEGEMFVNGMLLSGNVRKGDDCW